MKRLIPIVLFLGLLGCDAAEEMRPARTTAEQQEFKQQAARLDRVTVRLESGNRDICAGQRVGCPYRMTLGFAGHSGAYSDNSGNIYFTNKMARFLHTDDELALFVAHEWAHILVHTTRPQTQAFTREMEADCVGALLAQRSGFDVEKGAGAMRRFAQSPEGIFNTITTIGGEYPLWGQRWAGVSKAVEKAKATGQPNARETIRQVCGVAP